MRRPVLALGFQDSGLRVWAPNFGVWGLGFRISGSGYQGLAQGFMFRAVVKDFN